MTAQISRELTPEEQEYLRGWSWGAFISTPVWAVCNQLYFWALGSFVPLLNLYIWIKLSDEGRQVAWERGTWKSFEQFKKRQEFVKWAILAVFFLGFIVTIITTVSMSPPSPATARDI